MLAQTITTNEIQSVSHSPASGHQATLENGQTIDITRQQYFQLLGGEFIEVEIANDSLLDDMAEYFVGSQSY